VIIIPAVDLRKGRCVRLYQGRADTETRFSADPVGVAERWIRLGARRLHVVDLDGAFAGAPRQAALVEKIAAAIAPVPVQVGGGLRDAAAVDSAFAAGARWAVIGTRAVLDPAFLVEICRAHPGRIIVAVDGRGGRVAIKGWTELAPATIVDAGLRAQEAGAAALLYTDLDRDGTGLGPNVDDTAALAGSVSLPVLASGGVGSLEDLRRLRQTQAIAGVVIGRALYTGAIDLACALREVAGPVGSVGEERQPALRPHVD
jgi:phosphoribosylformimino-5-aminoimidazole carboxamide ribotide isomerase